MAVDIAPLAISIATFFGLYLILALSLNLEYGVAGLPNFGKVLFYSVGAYTAGSLTAYLLNAIGNIGGPGGFCSALDAEARVRLGASHPALIFALFLVSLTVAALIGGALGYLASYPALRLKEDFLAISLIFIGEIGRVFVRTYEPITCGVYGLGGIPNPLLGLADVNLSGFLYAAIVLGLAAFFFVGTNRYVNSPYGRVLKAIRDDELVARVLGKQTPRVKGEAFVLGSAMAAVAGVLYAYYVQAVYADDFIPILSFVMLAMVILGGAANNAGVLVGTLLITLLDRFTRASFLAILGIDVPFDITFFRYIAIGLLMVLLLMFRPAGLIGEKPVRTIALDLAKRAGDSSRARRQPPLSSGE